MYSLGGYHRMMADEVRMRVYVDALRAAVRPGSVVLDIGTGTGVFALLACRLGARRVFAVEPSQAAIAVARDMAAANGVSDRIEFITGMSTDVTLPEKADVVIAYLHGVLPLFRQLIPSVIDARNRLLAPGGVIMPGRDLLQVAVVTEPETVHGDFARQLQDEFDLSFDTAERYARNTWWKTYLDEQQLLVTPHCWTVLDYATVDGPDVSGEAEWTVDRPGVAHGIAVWFDGEPREGHRFSNAPGQPRTIHGQGYFPLERPVRLDPGDQVTVSLAARLVREEYVWVWSTVVREATDPARVKARFRQSTFLGTVFVGGAIDAVRDAHIPTLNEDGAVERTLLDLMDGTRNLEQLAAELRARFPDRFRSTREARRLVDEASMRFTQQPDEHGP